jgi:hypothetical protein
LNLPSPPPTKTLHGFVYDCAGFVIAVGSRVATRDADAKSVR